MYCKCSPSENAFIFPVCLLQLNEVQLTTSYRKTPRRRTATCCDLAGSSD